VWCRLRPHRCRKVVAEQDSGPTLAATGKAESYPAESCCLRLPPRTTKDSAGLDFRILTTRDAQGYLPTLSTALPVTDKGAVAPALLLDAGAWWKRVPAWPPGAVPVGRKCREQSNAASQTVNRCQRSCCATGSAFSVGPCPFCPEEHDVDVARRLQRSDHRGVPCQRRTRRRHVRRCDAAAVAPHCAKSGTRRINPLGYLSDKGRYVIFASKAGAPTNPDRLVPQSHGPSRCHDRGRDRHDRGRCQ